MKKILYIFLCGSIISMLLSFFFPIINYIEISSDIPVWIYGYHYIPFVEGINIFDISQKIISLLYIIITFFLIRSIFLLKNSDNLDLISEKWQMWGFFILALYFFWIMISFFFGTMMFVHPYGFKITFAFFFPIISGLLLIFARFLQTSGIGKGLEEKHDYKNVNWFKHQYYDLGKSIQDIANEQNISMITIMKWLDKIESGSQNKDDKNSANYKT